MKVSFIVHGKPVSKERPRFAKGHTYTPRKTLDYEREVACAYLVAAHGTKLHGALSLKARIYMQTPKSYSKKLKELLEGKPYCKKSGDIDNITKSLMDGMQDAAYDDDCQIYSLNIKQFYSVNPRAEIEIAEEGMTCV